MSKEWDPQLLALAKKRDIEGIKVMLRQRIAPGVHALGTISAVRERVVNRELQELMAVAHPPADLVVDDTRRFADLIENLANKKNHEDLLLLNPRQFEELVAEVWGRFGYDVELTAQTRDGGRDIVAVRKAEAAVKFLIECKRYDPSRKVEVSLVRALFGVKVDEGASKAIMATTSSLTRDAQEFVERHPWELEGRDYEGVLHWLEKARHFARDEDSFLWLPDWSEGS